MHCQYLLSGSHAIAFLDLVLMSVFTSVCSGLSVVSRISGWNGSLSALYTCALHRPVSVQQSSATGLIKRGPARNRTGNRSDLNSGDFR